MLSDELKNEIMRYLNECIAESKCEFLLGGYGNFDAYALKFGLELKKSNSALKLTLVSPYIDWGYLKKYGDYVASTYDNVIYPEIENVPKKYAISARNKWIVDESDIIVMYINHSYGGSLRRVSLRDKEKEGGHKFRQFGMKYFIRFFKVRSILYYKYIFRIYFQKTFDFLRGVC